MLNSHDYSFTFQLSLCIQLLMCGIILCSQRLFSMSLQEPTTLSSAIKTLLSPVLDSASVCCDVNGRHIYKDGRVEWGKHQDNGSIYHLLILIKGVHFSKQFACFITNNDSVPFFKYEEPRVSLSSRTKKWSWS